MRNRTLYYFLISLLVAAVLVGMAANVAIYGSKNTHSWMYVQQHNPLLWMVDGCAVIILLGSCLFGSMLTGQSQPADETVRRVASLTDAVEELLTQNSNYRARIEDLEDAGDAWHEGFENEARRLTEQAFLALSDNIESNAQQLEAITLALRHHRAELKSVRAALKTGELAPEADAPPALDTVSRPTKAILPELEKPTLEPELELLVEAEPESESEIEAESGLVEEAEEESRTEIEADPDPEIDSEETTDSKAKSEEDISEPIEPSVVQEQTVNASSTVV